MDAIRDRALPVLRALGIPLVMITNAKPKHLEWYLKKHAVDGVKIFSDVEMKSYKVAGMKYISTLKELMKNETRSTHFGKLKATSSLTWNVFRGGTGDFHQLGGTFVFGKNSELIYTWIDPYIEHAVEIPELLKQVGAPAHVIAAVPTGKYDQGKPKGGDPEWTVPDLELAPSSSVGDDVVATPPKETAAVTATPSTTTTTTTSTTDATETTGESSATNDVAATAETKEPVNEEPQPVDDSSVETAEAPAESPVASGGADAH